VIGAEQDALRHAGADERAEVRVELCARRDPVGRREIGIDLIT
jgi:hypothetical protein